MSHSTVVYDACVLYPSPLRNFLMYLAITDLYHARWTNDIHEEWMRNVVKDHADITREQVERIRDLMNANVRDCLVMGYESLIGDLTLPDPDDRHVLAAAIHCGADVIVTFNLKHFPENALKPHGIEAQHPDEFLASQLDLASDVVCSAAKKQRSSLKNPPMCVEAFLASLERQGLHQTVSESVRKPRLFWVAGAGALREAPENGGFIGKFVDRTCFSDRHSNLREFAELIKQPTLGNVPGTGC